VVAKTRAPEIGRSSTSYDDAVQDGPMDTPDAKELRLAPLATPTDLKANAVRDISGALNILLADMFGLYMKTKNFHWHVSGSHFRDYHLMFDEQAEQIFATTDDIAERIRKIGSATLRSISHISRLQRILDNNAEYVTPKDMLAELREDNRQLTADMREIHDLCDEHRDVATANLIENWIDEAERRAWFLFEASRTAE
jgi:starvation-inducible DNA-binding protein